MTSDADMFPKIAAARAAEVVARFEVELEPEARALLGPESSARDFMRALLENGRGLDAVRFLAHALDRREAVWWACLCAREALAVNPPAPALEALSRAEAWVAEPSEDNRRAAQAAAQAAGFGTPAGLAAMAAFMSEGSITTPDADAVPAPESVLGQMVFAAAEIAGLANPQVDADERYRAFLAKGIEIAMGAPIGAAAA